MYVSKPNVTKLKHREGEFCVCPVCVRKFKSREGMSFPKKSRQFLGKDKLFFVLHSKKKSKCLG